MTYLFLITYALAGAFLVKVLYKMAEADSKSSATDVKHRSLAKDVLKVNKSVIFFFWPVIACGVLFG